MEDKVHLVQTKMQILHSLAWQILPGSYIDQIGAEHLCSQPLAQSVLVQAIAFQNKKNLAEPVCSFKDNLKSLNPLTLSWMHNAYKLL